MVCRIFRAGSVWVICLLAVGCATVQQPLTDADFMRHMEASTLAVDGLLAQSKRDEAVALLRQVAATAPQRAEPWGQLAKLHFDAGDYGNAIVAADEVLKRVPGEKQALSLRAVGGLRVATSALVAMQGAAETTGSARADAAKLAKALRESLGEEVLVPPVATVAPTERRSGGPVAGRRARSPAATSGQAVRNRISHVPTVNGDPFSILK